MKNKINKDTLDANSRQSVPLRFDPITPAGREWGINACVNHLEQENYRLRKERDELMETIQTFIKKAQQALEDSEC